jgi:hypothetical protein
MLDFSNGMPFVGRLGGNFPSAQPEAWDRGLALRFGSIWPDKSKLPLRLSALGFIAGYVMNSDGLTWSTGRQLRTFAACE